LGGILDDDAETVHNAGLLFTVFLGSAKCRNTFLASELQKKGGISKTTFNLQLLSTEQNF
jgi:hypothetical protein